jgi:hypothetical protein
MGGMGLWHLARIGEEAVAWRVAGQNYRAAAQLWGHDMATR